MFLKVQGVTGETVDSEHKGEIDIVGWSWGMESPTDPMSGQARGRTVVHELNIVKRVDQATSTLMLFLRNNKVVPEAKLTVRKAGGEKALEYLIIELEGVRITSLKTGTENHDLIERLTLGFNKVRVTYTPQGKTGGSGGGKNVFETDAHEGA